MQIKDEAFYRNKLMSQLQGYNKGKMKIDSEVPIPYKHIYLPGDKPILEIWCFKQDIAIYKKLYGKDIGYKDAIITKHNEEIINVILEKDSSQNTHDVGMPYVIIETKNGQPNTHEILTYSQKVQMIKTIFPYCRFVFLIFGKISARTYRHGLDFDKIISIENVNNKTEINKLKREINKLLKEVKQDIINIEQ